MKTLFERMAEAQQQRVDEREAIRTAQPGDTVPAAPRKADIRPAFTGAGKTSFKPVRNGKK